MFAVFKNFNYRTNQDQQFEEVFKPYNTSELFENYCKYYSRSNCKLNFNSNSSNKLQYILKS